MEVTRQVRLASNMTRAAEASCELVNLAVGGAAQGKEYAPVRGDELTERFCRSLGRHWATRVRQTADASTRIEQMARDFRTVFAADSDEATVESLNYLLHRYGTRPYLARDSDQPIHLHFHGDADTPVESLGGEFAAALALVVDMYGQARLGICNARHCDRAYVDLTRNGSRRYCSNGCGARAKMAAYRARSSFDESP